MKVFMIRLVMALSFISHSTWANTDINEYKTDLYYANGMGMELSETKALETWQSKVRALKKSNLQLKNTTPKIAYNSSTKSNNGDGIEDYFEVLLQWIGQSPERVDLGLNWSLTKEFNLTYIKWLQDQKAKLSEILNIVDLNNHIAAYKQSIESGRGVVVVAHSQGNFFTNKAYGILDYWMQPYFHMIGVASPAISVAGGGPRISFDNDPVHLFSSTTDSITNPNRAQPDLPSLDFHSFAYYMGEPVLSSGSFVSTNIAKVKIENAILAGVSAHQSAPSQWKNVRGMNGCDCESNRVQVAHNFDSDLDIKLQDEDVFNFNSDGKIYSVNGLDYVRAVVGGKIIENVLSNDVCYLLKDKVGTELADISGSSQVFDRAPSGLFTAQLTWQQPQVKLSMSSSLMGQSVSACGMAALGSGERTLFSVYPGTHPINVTAQGYEALEDQEFSDVVSLAVNVPGKRTNYSERMIFSASQYPALGHVADIVITRPVPNKPPKVELVPSLPSAGGKTSGYGRSWGHGGGGSLGGWGGYYGGGGGGGGGGGSSSLLTVNNPLPVTQEKPWLCTPKKSCGCLPCKFDVLSYLNQAKLGPISGARIVLYKATEAHKVDKQILFEGLTSVSA
jgi:uncharacterized membrane protein YgcG